MNLIPFQFEKSELWDAVLSELDTALEADTASALDAATQGENRIHAAGRASALIDFKNHLLWVRANAAPNGSS